VAAELIATWLPTTSSTPHSRIRSIAARHTGGGISSPKAITAGLSSPPQ